jgi:hypothetical protein
VIRHWNTIRHGAGGTVFGAVLGPRLGLPPASDESRKQTEKILKNALQGLQNVWLKDAPFILGTQNCVDYLSDHFKS